MGSTFCKAEPYCCLDGPLGTQVNLTYAFDMGNYWCFDGFPEYMGWNITNTTTNGTNVTNGTGTPTIPVLPTNIVVPSYVPWKPTPDWLNNITNGTIDDLNLQYYEDIYNFTTIPTLLNAIFGSICVIVCVLVVITYIFIAIYQPVIAKRCSLRLSIAVCCADLVFSLCQALTNISNEKDDWKCTGAAITQVLAETMSLFFTSMIALNLLLVFVFDFSDTKKIEPFYYIFPVLASIVLQIYPMANSYLGYANGNCFYRVEGYNDLFKAPDYHTRVNTLEWAFYTSWLFINIVFCAVVTVAFWTTLVNRQNQKSKSISAGTSAASTGGSTTKKGSGGHSDSSSKIQESSQKLIQKAVVRIAWYPVVPLVTAIPLALNMSVPVLRASWQFGWFCAIINNFQGIFNALIFYNDPAVALFRENNRKALVDKHVLRYHPVQPTGERVAKAIPRPGWRENIHYVLTRFFLAGKQDFVIENKKRGTTSSTGTKTSNVATRTGNATILKSNAMEMESQAGTETINATDTMISSSAQPDTGTIMEAEAPEPPGYQPTIQEEPREREPFINAPTMDAIVDLEQGFEMKNGLPDVVAQEIVPTQEASYIPVGTEQDDGEEEELTMQESLQAMQHF